MLVAGVVVNTPGIAHRAIPVAWVLDACMIHVLTSSPQHPVFSWTDTVKAIMAQKVEREFELKAAESVLVDGVRLAELGEYPPTLPPNSPPPPSHPPTNPPPPQHTTLPHPAPSPILSPPPYSYPTPLTHTPSLTPDPIPGRYATTLADH
jgi:hypothetical protein